MNKKRWTFLLIALLIVTTVGVLAGCSDKRTVGYDFLVTFDYNTEGLQLDTEYTPQYLGVKTGSRIMQPVKPASALYQNSDFKEKQIDRYEVVGWHLPARADDGSVVKNEDGSVELDRQWDFAVDVVSENITLYARLAIKPSLKLMDGDNVLQEKRYIQGSRVTEIGFSPLAPTKAGYTFYGYYADEKLKERFTFPFQMGSEDVTLYARFVEGENWTFVSTAQAFNDAYHASARIYLDADLDFTDVTWKSKIEFGGELYGAGHKISNITCTVSNTIKESENLGLFGKLTKSARIHDVTFENVVVTVDTVSAVPVQAGLLAWRIEAGATLDTVTVQGSIRKGNIYAGGEASLYPVCIGYPVSGVTVTDCDFDDITVVE